MLAAGVAAAAPACAAQTYGYGYPRNGGYSRELERRAYDNGFREGAGGSQDGGAARREFSLPAQEEFRGAEQGHPPRRGDFDLYRRSYRQGFQTGYNEAFNRFTASNGRYPRGTYPTYPAYPSNRGYPSGSPAAQNGYRDGVEAGRDDARNRGRFDPVRARRYREGDHDYNGRYGSRDDYKRE